MRLRSLEVQGFKSFSDKTVFRFGDGITAIVGPNGSGKSNISDAVRWVLGEQSTKTLRGSKMEDVIFGGTQTRKATGFASVVLTIDNADRTLPVEEDVISISRRLYRSGESEYRLCGAAVRLKDIHELLMDTGLGRDGYSIIGQGRIAEIVSAKSQQRREIFEEAAGISRFRYRKIEAERKLEQAEENLLRLRDILVELEDRIGPLREQAEKAKKYLSYAQEKQQLEISIWMVALSDMKEQLRVQSDRLYLCKNQYEGVEGKIRDIEEAVSDLYSRMQGLSAETDRLRGEIRTAEEAVSKNEADIAVRRNDIFHNRQSIERIQGELETAGLSLSQSGEQIAARKQEAKEQSEALRLLDEKLAVGEGAMAELRKKLAGEEQTAGQLEAQITSVEQAAAQARLSDATSASLMGEAQERLVQLQGSDQSKDTILGELAAILEECKTQIREKEEEAASLLNTQKGYRLKLEARKSRLGEARQSLEQLESQKSQTLQQVRLLEELESSMEGFAGSVKYILGQSKKGALRGIYGPVSSLVTADSRYAVAIETALGGALQNLVVSDEAAAKAAIRALQSAKMGRATFLPVTSVKGRPMDGADVAKYEGFVGIASSLVEYEERFSGVVGQLLGRVVITEDLDCGTQIAKAFGYRFRIVTLDGQVINAGGSFTGGSSARSAGALSRRHEISRLREQAETLEQRLVKQRDSLREFQQEIDGLEASFTGVSAEIRTNEEEKIRLAYELRQLESNHKQALDNQKMAQQELERLLRRVSELKDTSQSSRQLVSELEERLADLREQAAQAKEQRSLSSGLAVQLQSELEALRMSRLGAAKDLEQLLQTVAQLVSARDSAGEQSQRLKSEVEALEAQNLATEEQIGELTRQCGALREKTATMLQATENMAADRLKLEAEITAKRAAEREISGEKEQISRELARLEERKLTLQGEYDGIISRLWDEYELTRSQAKELAVELEDKQKAQHRLSQLKSLIKGLGSVNVAAVEEYEQVSERYEFMSAQVRDVENSKEQLGKLIAQLTQEMRAIFTENFARIAEHFSRIFVELFGGGKGQLTLTQEEDVLESGVEIYVQPPGKLIKNLSLLSGGEQAFIAIAIYFAILKVRPAPFCLLDEIEAALDDVNVVKFASYLRQMCRKTQFIAITHRRGTMEEADMLYGVTMEDEGVSKILELNVSEVEDKLSLSI
ncbi:chromosome segregation protein SMC [Oscillospiraceae bacterium MB08-C2-2]|nr:chromosome segregation protein SMC [Oscillospiraceae bacterium MB08-C2-2]